MIDSVFKRAIFSFAFFWIGIHAVGFGMAENGFDHPRNPVWAALSGLFQAEVIILRGLFCCGVVSGVIFIAAKIYQTALTPEKTAADINDSGANHNLEKSQAEKLEPGAIKLAKQNHQPQDSPPSATAVEIQIEQVQEPPKAPPTPGALKHKAIDQILRGY